MIKAIFQFFNNVAFFIKRMLRKIDDPLDQHRERYKQIDKDINSEDSKKATINSTSDFVELERLQKHSDNTKRSDGDKNEKG